MQSDSDEEEPEVTGALEGGQRPRRKSLSLYSRRTSVVK